MNLAQIIEDALTASSGADVFVYRLDGVMLNIEIGIHDHERGRRQRIRVDVVTVVALWRDARRCPGSRSGARRRRHDAQDRCL